VSAAFDLAALERWLAQNIAGFKGPIALEQFQNGRSNPTYRLTTPAHVYVLRAKPGPAAKLLPSAHAIEREFRVMQALARTDVPVPRVHVLCPDESVIGRAFFIMDFVAGRVFFEQSLPDSAPHERAAIYDAMNGALAALHRLDWRTLGLETYGRPGNYFARQIARWTQQYEQSAREPIDAMARLAQWLPAHIPNDGETAIVHGDFRLDNLIFNENGSRVRAALDWELSTLGHPLADLAYHCLTWHVTPHLFRGVAGLDLVALGIPSERDYVGLYCERAGRDFAQVMRHWNFCIAFNLFRLAAILEGVARRAQDGMEASAGAAAEGARVRPLAELGWKTAQRG
jgi:aminoglycoside phosphotransferase (APT) family kinase protein